MDRSFALTLDLDVFVAGLHMFVLVTALSFTCRSSSSTLKTGSQGTHVGFFLPIHPLHIQSIGLSSFVLLKLLDVLDSAGSTLFFFWPFHNWLCTISIICQGKTSLTALYSVINPSHLPVKIVFLAGSLPFAPLTLVWCPGSSCQVPSAPPGFGNENTL